MSTGSQTTSALLAARSLAGLLPQVAAAAAGASVLGLFAGWREATAYYAGLGAPWFVVMLTPSMLLQHAAVILTFLVLSAWFSIYGIASGDTSAKRLRKYTLAGLIVSLVLLLPGILPADWISKKSLYWCAVVDCIAIAVTAGTLIGDVVARLAISDLKWSSYQAWLLYTVAFLGLELAPDQLGMAKAQYHLDPASHGLPTIELISPTPNRSWRLVSLLGNQALIVSLGEGPDARVFRIVNDSDIIEIRSTEAGP